jgi:8-oxo-dGTP pyrophosphatase MutT (NUDIX family)
MIRTANVAAALAQPAPARFGWVRRRAAVAVILRDGAEGAEVLLIRRAARRGDPWSGHVALPGGVASADDADLLATARREVREEVQIDLGLAPVLGRLPTLVTRAHAVMRPMSLSPWVFSCAIEGTPSPDEVDALFWVPLGALVSGAHDTVRPWRMAGRTWSMAAWDWQGQMIWGLTHHILRGLLKRLG